MTRKLWSGRVAYNDFENPSQIFFPINIINPFVGIRNLDAESTGSTILNNNS